MGRFLKHIVCLLCFGVILPGIGGLCVCPAGTLPQDEREQGQEKLTLKPVTSLSFDFIQTKTSAMLAEKAVATGSMTFAAPDHVRWEYKTPTRTVFDSSAMASGKNKGRFRQFFALISSLAASDSFESDANFNVQVEDAGKCWAVTMTPLRKDLRQLFVCLRLSISKQDSVARRIEIEERGGDLTVIECSNVKSE